MRAKSSKQRCPALCVVRVLMFSVVLALYFLLRIVRRYRHFAPKYTCHFDVCILKRAFRSKKFCSIFFEKI